MLDEKIGSPTKELWSTKHTKLLWVEQWHFQTKPPPVNVEKVLAVLQTMLAYMYLINHRMVATERSITPVFTNTAERQNMLKCDFLFYVA
ncbi:hypothetical protein T265_04281 [Opisthorchis viverrini]|uniref:Uncharacterized protein n=1 Tax=Opisthorchis viverrini TaxID=6198 RepID=A0A075AGR4_OPIVI|nr:hypothetical protein T265_04281 [Opisthorchis viverrini]KER28984.1 hypothetical protein T265_04281 [Opisthorchis viverrini]